VETSRITVMTRRGSRDGEMVVEALRALPYQLERCWFELRVPVSGPAILVLDDEDVADAADLIPLVGDAAVIVVTAPALAATPPLPSTADLCVWPCSSQELFTRLHRIVRPRAPASPPGVDTDLTSFGIIGRSPKLLVSMRRLRKLAACDAAVLIEGETGTGKEVAARALHYLGPRRERPFVPVNCGGIPDTLFESELFGHARGAFTHAIEARLGLVSMAGAGSLFFDEVDSLSAKGQVTLLRFLQERRYREVGGDRERTSEAGIIAASNRDLRALVEAGAFRQDLYFRLRIGCVSLPSLRERTSDIALLARHFLRIFAGHYHQPLKVLDGAALAWLELQPWEGNVRELENLLHRAFLLSEGRVLGVADLAAEDPAPEREAAPFECSFDEARRQVVEAFERNYLADLMRHTRGNVSRAARLAGKERRSLGRLLAKHDIDREEFAKG
jgi:two-component system, NtrC family, response regulator GlrR